MQGSKSCGFPPVKQDALSPSHDYGSVPRCACIGEWIEWIDSAREGEIDERVVCCEEDASHVFPGHFQIHG